MVLYIHILFKLNTISGTLFLSVFSFSTAFSVSILSSINLPPWYFFRFAFAVRFITSLNNFLFFAQPFSPFARRFGQILRGSRSLKWTTPLNAKSNFALKQLSATVSILAQTPPIRPLDSHPFLLLFFCFFVFLLCPGTCISGQVASWKHRSEKVGSNFVALMDNRKCRIHDSQTLKWFY